MEPDAAAIALCISPYHLAIPRSFYTPIMQSVRSVPWSRSKGTKGVSPYGLSPHCLFSTDSLVPLLPVKDPLGRPLHALAQEIALYKSNSTMDSEQPTQELGSEKSSKPPKRVEVPMDTACIVVANATSDSVFSVHRKASTVSQ